MVGTRKKHKPAPREKKYNGKKYVQKTQPTTFYASQAWEITKAEPTESSCLCARDNKTRAARLAFYAKHVSLFHFFFVQRKKSFGSKETKARRHIKISFPSASALLQV